MNRETLISFDLNTTRLEGILQQKMLNKEAVFYKKEQRIFMWTSRNVSTYKYCPSLEYAKALIKNTGIEQSLLIN